MTLTQITKYEKLGWTFRHEEWQNHHNGDWEHSYYIKSPRLAGEFAGNWAELTERQLLKREVETYADERLGEDLWGSNTYRLREAAIKVLVRDPDAKSITVTIKLI